MDPKKKISNIQPSLKKYSPLTYSHEIPIEVEEDYGQQKEWYAQISELFVKSYNLNKAVLSVERSVHAFQTSGIFHIKTFTFLASIKILKSRYTSFLNAFKGQIHTFFVK